MKARWQDWFTLIFGAWMLFSPWLLFSPLALRFYTQALATWNMVIVGLVVAAFSGYILRRQYFAPWFTADFIAEKAGA